MNPVSSRLIFIGILLVAVFLRFYNLMFDAPYFFNPDERNMGNAIVQFKLPTSLKDWPGCIYEQIVAPMKEVRIKNYELTRETEQPQPQADPPMAETPHTCNLHPHFFAYGQFPLYLSFFSDRILTHASFFLPSNKQPNYQLLATSYESAIFWLRFWSALSSVATVYYVYRIGHVLFQHKKTKERYLPHIGAFFVTVTPNLIQSAHFGTTESLLTFFLITSVYLSIKLLPSSDITTGPKTPHFAKTTRGKHLMTYIPLSFIISCAVGTKLTGLFCLVPPAMVALIQFFSLWTKQNKIKQLGIFFSSWLFFLSLTILGSILTSPYNLIEYTDFTSAVFGYEKDVATGAYKAFYTRQFEGSIPGLFHIQNIFPFALGRPLFLFGSMGLVFTIGIFFSSLLSSIWHVIQRRQRETIYTPPASMLFVLLSLFFLYSTPHMFLYAKWTRFMTPILPFFSLFSLIFLWHIFQLYDHLQHKHQWHRILSRAAFVYFLVLIATPGIGFFSLYTRPDTRVSATHWMYKNIPSGSHLLYDTGNVIDIPLGLPEKEYPEPRPSYTQTSFDFYHLDENPLLFESLIEDIETADYILIPSRRIFANYMRLPQEYPLVTNYYQALFDGSLGFEQVTELSSFPSLGPIIFPDEHAEETSTVFDHPVVRIYKKITPHTQEKYRQLLQSRTSRPRR